MFYLNKNEQSSSTKFREKHIWKEKSKAFLLFKNPFTCIYLSYCHPSIQAGYHRFSIGTTHCSWSVKKDNL